jgi:transposase
MSLQPTAMGPVPEETARVARAAFPHGNGYLQIRDVLGPMYDDASFAPLFASRGRPAETPWRLALITVLQFAEGLSDRQAADAVRGRIDWKYVLGLELSDPGFNFSVLSEFRTRLVEHAAEALLLDTLLSVCRAHGALKVRGQQRTDATHVLGALRCLNRLEQVGETLRAALNAVAGAAPNWLVTQVPPEWFDRYRRRIEEERLPKGRAARDAYATTVGEDGFALLERLTAPSAPAALDHLPAVERLRELWGMHYRREADTVRLRPAAELPPAREQPRSPYESEARYGRHGPRDWIGYKVHLTETCDADGPHLVTQVTTTVAPASDVECVASIQADLAQRDRLPAIQVADAGYLSAGTRHTSQRDHQIDLLGPLPTDQQWQARAASGYAAADFRIDWAAEVVTCPQGRASRRWQRETHPDGPGRIRATFAAADCTPCPARAQCTHAARSPRSVTFPTEAESARRRADRQRQQTPAFAAQYAVRAGIEGTISQGVRGCGLRHARYRGLAKTHLQHLATATALNLQRLVDWLNEVPRAPTRRSHFAALAPASP